MNKSKRNYLILKKVKNRDNYICQKCGSKNNLEVHHIKCIYFGGKDNEDNCITLCKTCHIYSPLNPDLFYKYLSIPLSISNHNIVIALISFKQFLHSFKSISIDDEWFKDYLDTIIKLLNINYDSCKSWDLWNKNFNKIFNLSV